MKYNKATLSNPTTKFYSSEDKKSKQPKECKDNNNNYNKALSINFIK